MAFRPARLRDGARIGIVSPAYWPLPDRLARAVGEFRDRGFDVVLGDNVGLREDKYAGPPEARAADLMAMFTDPSIDAIICARGGYGVNRVLPLLDYDMIAVNPKILVGFSDITGLLTTVSQQCEFVTFHGPMLTTFGRETVPYNIDTLLAVLSGEDNVEIRSTAGCQARVLAPGEASGPLWGGNLSLLIERLATPGQVCTDGAILFIEDIDEKLHAFDRMLLQLRSAGCLDGIRGLVVGEMLEMHDGGDVSFGKDTDAIIMDVFGDLGIPIISHFPCGHGDCQATLPVAHTVELHADPDDPRIRIPQSPVS
ncbi:LD-carboxypeptidase [Marinihelvus fidelis]|uniref:LD-carboxypeptidase n=1 Tax=Marinihelvus fidelis TaxID=2613842 RepID=A0A5N0TEA5_9GAMM|nr:LD-carboxypeptidase [Marinihelvus fidelis]KAA9132794.1 LD-carboxypeptidase [Marinihelvus fidelis]